MDRIKDSYQKQLYDFIKYDIETVCPKCNKKALVKTNNFSLKHSSPADVKLVCVNCGYSKLLSEKPATVLSILTGAPVDPFFQTPLWLTANIEGEVLWAYNQEHLDFLRAHIEAKLRERNGVEIINKSIGSRLPKWMISKKNRGVVLKALEDLKQKK